MRPDQHTGRYRLWYANLALIPDCNRFGITTAIQNFETMLNGGNGPVFGRNLPCLTITNVIVQRTVGGGHLYRTITNHQSFGSGRHSSRGGNGKVVAHSHPPHYLPSPDYSPSCVNVSVEPTVIGVWQPRCVHTPAQP